MGTIRSSSSRSSRCPFSGRQPLIFASSASRVAPSVTSGFTHATTSCEGSVALDRSSANSSDALSPAVELYSTSTWPRTSTWPKSSRSTPKALTGWACPPALVKLSLPSSFRNGLSNTTSPLRYPYVTRKGVFSYSLRSGGVASGNAFIPSLIRWRMPSSTYPATANQLPSGSQLLEKGEAFKRVTMGFSGTSFTGSFSTSSINCRQASSKEAHQMAFILPSSGVSSVGTNWTVLKSLLLPFTAKGGSVGGGPCCCNMGWFGGRLSECRQPGSVTRRDNPINRMMRSAKCCFGAFIVLNPLLVLAGNLGHKASLLARTSRTVIGSLQAETGKGVKEGRKSCRMPEARKLNMRHNKNREGSSCPPVRKPK